MGCKMTNDDRVELAAIREKLIEAANDITEILIENAPKPQVQTSGPRCKKCNSFTTYKRVNSHGFCMRCEFKNG